MCGDLVEGTEGSLGACGGACGDEGADVFEGLGIRRGLFDDASEEFEGDIELICGGFGDDAERVVGDGAGDAHAVGGEDAFGLDV